MFVYVAGNVVSYLVSRCGIYALTYQSELTDLSMIYSHLKLMYLELIVSSVI
jgi:hypothetical protein